MSKIHTVGEPGRPSFQRSSGTPTSLGRPPPGWGWAAPALLSPGPPGGWLPGALGCSPVEGWVDAQNSQVVVDCLEWGGGGILLAGLELTPSMLLCPPAL